ncbi:MAG: arylsulfatase regulator [Roseiarcus sp.]
MTPTAEQLRIAATIDAKAQQLLGAGCIDAIILGEMFDYMPAFKQLLDSVGQNQSVLDELCERFPSFNRYAKILENVAGAIQSGALKDMLP